MAEDFFRINRGLEIDEVVQYLQGTGSPGTGDSGNAQVGSVYTDTLDGSLWTKITAGVGIQHWSKQASQSWVTASVAGAVSWREPVEVIATGVTTLPTGVGSNIVDGVTIVNGQRVLFPDLSSGTPNVYVYDATNEVYVEDTNTLSQGDTIYVDAGTSGGTRWTWNGTAWVRFDSSSLDELQYIRSFIGKTATGAIMPTYTSTSVITQNSSLTAAISALDLEVGNNASGWWISASDNVATNLQALDSEIGQNVVNGNYILAANTVNANISALDVVFGAPITGSHHWISEAQHVNGNLIALADELGANVSNGNFILAANTVNQNIQALDFHLGAAVVSGNVIINTNSANQNIQLLDTKLGSVTDGNHVLSSSTISANINALDSFIGSDIVDGTYVLAANTLVENVQAIDNALTQISKESTVAGVTTSTVIDSIAATVIKWIVKVVDAANSANVQAVEIFAATNGLTADFTKFATLKLGANIPGLMYNVVLNGSNLQLTVQSTASVNVTARRVTSI
jgi:hypothetical protein